MTRVTYKFSFSGNLVAGVRRKAGGISVNLLILVVDDEPDVESAVSPAISA